MNTKITTVLAVLLIASAAVAQGGDTKFDKASSSLEQQLKDSMKELADLREKIGAEKIPLSTRLSELEAELSQVRQGYQDKTRDLDGRNLDLSNLRRKIKAKKDEAAYLKNLLNDYLRGFEARLHIAELKRYEQELKRIKDVVDDENADQDKIYNAQVELVNLSLKRLEGLAAGDRFAGTALNEASEAVKGDFVVIGPVAFFRSMDGKVVGTSDQLLGSLEPSAIPFGNPTDTDAASKLIESKSGELPLDPTMGNAHKIESTEDTFLEHVAKGGTVMYPIFGMAGIALLIALYKWLSFLFLRRPSRRRTEELLDTVSRGDYTTAREQAARMRGPLGRMLTTGTEHLDEPKELIEEVMYESVLRTESKLQRMLPFIAVCAASAPLLGLLGTVTGIINTFKMITVFGSGDVKSLSGGISEALITTKFGLIVAIPSLLLHAYLSRKAKRVTNQMETMAIAFVNRAGIAENAREREESGAGSIKRQVAEVLTEMLQPVPPQEPAGVSQASNS